MFALQMKEMIIEHPAVHIDVLQSTVNVSLKITYEFSTLTVNELVGVINYEITLTKLGNISVSTAPQLTIFESTGMFVTLQDTYFDVPVLYQSIFVVV